MALDMRAMQTADRAFERIQDRKLFWKRWAAKKAAERKAIDAEP